MKIKYENPSINAIALVSKRRGGLLLVAMRRVTANSDLVGGIHIYIFVTVCAVQNKNQNTPYPCHISRPVLVLLKRIAMTMRASKSYF